MHTLLFYPFPQYLRFGGETLKYRKQWRDSDHRDGLLAEVWEISDHRLHSSVVRSGPHAGRPLNELLAEHRSAVLGRHAPSDDARFPLMIRLLDVQEHLVPAIHPGPGGSPDGAKYEAGYVLECEPGAKLFSGVRKELTAADVLAKTIAGESFDTMDAWEVKPDECYYVPAGKLHAWGTGNLLYEVHTISNAIFALDWLDWDKDEARRQSDRDQLFQWLDIEARGSGRCEPKVVSEKGGKREVCCQNEHFVLERITTNQPLALGHDENRFHLYTLIRGSGRLSTNEDIEAFDTFLVPAQNEGDTFTPNSECTLLKAYLS